MIVTAGEHDIILMLREAGFRTLSRNEWGAQYENVYQERRKSKPFTGNAHAFFAHVTVTNPTGIFAHDVRLVEQIGYDRFQSGVSYNYLVDQKDGSIAIGQPFDAKGTHTVNDKNISDFPYNLNYYGHAIAWIGNVGDKPSQRCKDAFSAIIAVEEKLNIADNNSPVLPHSKFAAKECPLGVMRNALLSIRKKANVILDEKENWFAMLTNEEKKEIVNLVEKAIDNKLSAISQRIWWDSDLTPQQKPGLTPRWAILSTYNKVGKE